MHLMKTIFRLPPPPRFTLPPPLMLPFDMLDSKILLQLTCSSIRPQQQQINPQLFLLSCFTFFLVTILLTLSFLWIQSYRSPKTQLTSKLPPHSHRSYETISSGFYLESINTSATTLSTDPNTILYDEILSS